MAQIKSALVESNPWWKGVFSFDYKDRAIYGEISKFMKTRQIIALTGLRRVGKTTLLLKLVEDALAQGRDPKQILYFSFDEFKAAELREVLDAYAAMTGISLAGGHLLVLLDEVQKLEGWEEQLKRVYDLHRNVKIVISGSESLFLKKKSHESLAGRMFVFRVKPLSFREFLSFRQVPYKPVPLYEKELLALFHQFVRTSGFPELLDTDDRDIIRKYIRETVVEKILYRDIPTMLPIKDVGVLAAVFGLIAEDPGQLLELNSLSRDIGISRNTLSNYLHYLEEAYLVRKLYNFSRNKRKTERKLKKYYPAIISPTLAFQDDERSQSKVLETVMVLQLDAEFFWRDVYKNEVDIILHDPATVPIEIKYGKIETAGILRFMRQLKLDEGCIVTNDQERQITENGKKIRVVPAYKFLLE